jgi:glucose-1-phosphate adenylyltransferase
LHQHPPLPEEFSIGENCIIEKAIIDEHAYIGNKVRLINKDKLDTFDGDGVYIRDGIIIVTTGTKLPDGYTL